MVLFMNKTSLALLLTSVSAVLVATQVQAVSTKYTQDCKPFGAGAAPTYDDANASVSDDKTSKALIKAQEQISKHQNAEAVPELNAIIASAKRPADSTNAQYLLSFAYYGMQQPDRAEVALKEALKNAQLLTADQQQQMQQNLAFIKASTAHYNEALAATQEYFRLGGAQKAEMYTIAATAYSQQGKQQDAICSAYIALSKGGTLKMYDTLISSHWVLNDFEDLPAIINEAMQKMPSEPSYLGKLATVYLQLKKDKEALDAYEKAFEKGYMSKESEIGNLAALLDKQDKSDRAAEVIEASIAKGNLKANEHNWRAVANFWFRANKADKRINALSECAKYADSGECDLFRADALSDLHKWPDASTAYQAAIAKGKLKDEGIAWYNLGYAQYRSAQFKESMASLKKASTFESVKKDAIKMIKTVEPQLQ